MKYTVALNVEVSDRDLKPRLILANILLEHGYDVIIGVQRELLTLLQNKYVNVDIFIDKSISAQKNKFYKILKECDTKIFSFDEEGGFLREDIDRFILARSSQENIDIIDGVFCWGSYDYDAMCKLYPNNIDKLIQSGSPRVLYWRSINKIDNNKTKNNVFVASNFSLVNSYLTFEDLFNNAVMRGSYITNDSLIFKRKYEEEKIRLLNFTKKLENYIINNQNKKIFLKPHPSENPSYWKHFSKKFDNVTCVLNTTTTELLSISSLLIHDSCTTGIEALFSGTNVLSFSQNNNFANTKNLNDVSKRINIDFNDKLFLRTILESTKSKHLNNKSNKFGILWIKFKFDILKIINRYIKRNMRTYAKTDEIIINDISNNVKVSNITSNVFKLELR